MEKVMEIINSPWFYFSISTALFMWSELLGMNPAYQSNAVFQVLGKILNAAKNYLLKKPA